VLALNHSENEKNKATTITKDSNWSTRQAKNERCVDVGLARAVMPVRKLSNEARAD
jgi:hypothetical protein